MSSEKNRIAVWSEQHPFTNFAPYGVTTRDGRNSYPTTEHLYQQVKFLPAFTEIRQAIESAQTPLEAKQLAGQYHDSIRSDWPQLRYKAMKGIIRLKFRQHPQLQQELLATGNAGIYEDADKYAPKNPTPEQIAELRRWGIYQGKGDNWIGKILMEIRKELRSKSNE